MKKRLIGLLLCLLPAFTCAQAFAALPQGVDLDLSRLSGTVVYSQVYNMMLEPERYLGMTIRMAGYYSAYEDTEREIVYHACVIPDATACCAQGIEFVRGGEHVWPEDFPEEGADIVVTGRLEAYEEEGAEYLHLVDAELTWNAGAGTPD